MQRLQTLLSQGPFEMRDARILNRCEYLLDPLREHVDLGIECLFVVFAGESGPCPPGIDGDV